MSRSAKPAFCLLLVGACALSVWAPAQGQDGDEVSQLRKEVESLRAQRNRLQDETIKRERQFDQMMRDQREQEQSLRSQLAAYQGPLHQGIDLAAKRMALGDALEGLSLEGVRLEIDPACGRHVADKLTLKLAGMPLRYALDTMLLNAAGEQLAWTHADGVITVKPR